jgi:hypothetical protein
MAELKSIPVESIVHDGLRNIAQSVWDEYGICIKNVRFTWLEVSTISMPKLVVTEVEAETLTKE